MQTPRGPWRARSDVAGDFAERVIQHQPLTYARTIASDFLRGFAPTRTTEHGEVPVARWMFQTALPGLQLLARGPAQTTANIRR